MFFMTFCALSSTKGMDIKMNSSSRTEKSLLNVLTGVIGQILSFVLSFAIRTVFIHTLGEAYLGLNGLYTNILSVLNLTELGIGTAIVIELYRTVALNNEEKTKQYLQFYKKAYYCIGLCILTIGLILTPFLNYFIKDTESVALINYRLVFLLYLFNTAFSYFFFAYRNSILQANQQEYKLRIINYIFKFVEMILQIITLIIFKNIYLYLIIPLILGCIATVVKGILIGKWYPFILEKPKGKLSKEEVKNTKKNIFSVALYKISGTVINSTDNIIVSSFISIILTGIYSNYLILISAVNTMLEILFSAFTASLGNLNVEAAGNIEKKYSIFKILSFLNFWMYGFCSVCFLVLFDPFIRIWIGEKYIMNSLTEYIIVVNFLIVGLQETIGTHRAAYGLFYKGRYRPVFSVLLNIISSIVFVKIFPAEYGIVAVLLGTIVSNIAVSWWFDSYLVFKYAFNKKPISFYVTFWKRFIYVMIIGIIFRKISMLLPFSGIMEVIIDGILVTIVYNVIFILLFCKKDEFKYLRNSITNLVARRIKK